MTTRRDAAELSPTARCSRRRWLAATSGLAATSLAAAAVAPRLLPAAEDAPAAGIKNIELGMHTGPFTTLPLAEAAARIRDLGLTCVLTEYTFADVRFDPLQPDWKAADRIVKTLEKHGVRIVATFGYVNVVDPNPQRRKQGMARLDCLIQNGKRLGCSNVSTETGTYNTASDWADDPKNFTEQGYVECRDALRRLADKAEKAGAVVSIEAYWKNIIDSVERAERLFSEVQSPGLRLVMDPCNYLRKEDLPRQDGLLEAMFRRLGGKIVVAHAKDVKPSAEGTDLPAAGKGVLNYRLYLRLVASLGRPMPLLLEHLAADDVQRARDYVRGEMAKL